MAITYLFNQKIIRKQKIQLMPFDFLHVNTHILYILIICNAHKNIHKNMIVVHLVPLTELLEAYVLFRLLIGGSYVK